MNAPVRIENRTQLIYLLTEAAELEHGIMCRYLFSAFSMKRAVSEGIAEEHLPIMRRWRGTIMQIAIQEMVHMSLACNILTAVGGAPHLNRPNLPSSPKAYPPSFRLHLEPFNRETLESFVFIEKPEDQEGGDSRPPLQLIQGHERDSGPVRSVPGVARMIVPLAGSILPSPPLPVRGAG